MQTPIGVLVEVRRSLKLSREEALVADYASSIGIPVITASQKQVERKKLIIPEGYFTVGSVPFVRAALQQFGASLPEHTPYPQHLAHLFYREIRKLNSLREAKQVFDDGKRIFIKPADGWKRFTGFVPTHPDDHRFNGASLNKPVWISTPVRFLSEWRAYVLHGKVLDICFCDEGGDPEIKPDALIIKDAVDIICSLPNAPLGFVIDFGVLSTGETALIEMNDGFSFGAYERISPKTYFEVTAARWFQLLTVTQTNILNSRFKTLEISTSSS